MTVEDGQAAVQASNERILGLLSAYLSDRPDFVSPQAVDEITSSCAVTREEAFSMLLAAGCGLDIADCPDDHLLYRQYFPHMLRPLDASLYRQNPYYAQIRVPRAKSGPCALTHETYQPYEAFVFDDMDMLADGRLIPRIGYFPEAFPYPAMQEEGRIWMTITPNEIETMRGPIAQSRGKVLALGLGLGYFAFMASQRQEVSSVTVIEQNASVIRLFESHLLPQFPHRDKLRIIRQDAFSYLDNHLAREQYDLVFADLWHDVSDGLALSQRIRSYEPLAPSTRFAYWIEKTMRYYL